MNMRTIFYCFILLLLPGVAACSSGEPEIPPLPSPIPISDEAGQIIGEQPPGPLWVLVSGVDEHGLIAEHAVTLHDTAGLDATPLYEVHTGAPALVDEIQQGGPQNLRRFYRVTLPSGESGWLSDYYIRRRAYLYNDEGETVTLYASPEGVAVGQVGNVSPVILREATDPEWWLVQTADQNLVGWVHYSYVKESSQPEFLLNIQHEHP